MITAAQFLAASRAQGFDFYTGVPCSFLTPLINGIISNAGSEESLMINDAVDWQLDQDVGKRWSREHDEQTQRDRGRVEAGDRVASVHDGDRAEQYREYSDVARPFDEVCLSAAEFRRCRNWSANKSFEAARHLHAGSNRLGAGHRTPKISGSSEGC